MLLLANPVGAHHPPLPTTVLWCISLHVCDTLSSSSQSGMAEHSTVAPQQHADQGHKKSCAGMGEVPRRGEQVAGARAHPWLKPSAVGTSCDPRPFLHWNNHIRSQNWNRMKKM